MAEPNEGTCPPDDDFCDRFRELVPAIIDAWEAEVQRPPWSQLSRSNLRDHLPAFLTALADWSYDTGNDKGQADALIEAGARHGIQRRQLGLDYDIIMEESALLRRAIWSTANPSFDERHQMINIDSALTVGLMASLRGYAKPELTANGAWESSLTRMAADWAHVLNRSESH